MNPYQEIYVAYLRSRNRTDDDIKTLRGIALILKIEGMTLIQLRKLAITEREFAGQLNRSRDML